MEKMRGAFQISGARTRTQKADYERPANNEYFNGPSIFPLVIKRRVSKPKMNTSRHARASS